MAIPIEDILAEKPRLKALAKQLCSIHEIKTAEQLATYSRSAFRIGGNFRTPINTVRREKVMDYLEECLINAGMSFSRESPQQREREKRSGRFMAGKTLKTTS